MRRANYSFAGSGQHPCIAAGAAGTTFDRRHFLRLGLASGLVVWGTPCEAKDPSEKERGIFVRQKASTDEGTDTVSILTPDGKQTHLVDLPARYVKESMTLSPDGRFLSYYELTSVPMGSTDRKLVRTVLHLFDIDSRTDHTSRPNPDGRILEMIHWRPDGKYIGVERAQFDPMDRHVYRFFWGCEFDPSNGKTRFVNGHAFTLGSPTFSPDSEKVAYESPSGSLLVTAAKDFMSGSRRGWQTKELVSSDFAPKKPVWSPRGDLILYHAMKAKDDESEPYTLWLVDPEGKEQRQVGSQTYGAKSLQNISGFQTQDPMRQAASWSPDGAHLAFKVRQSGESIGLEPQELIIQRLDVDANRTQAISKPLLMPSYDQLVHWSPDGASLAFTARASSDAHLAVWTVKPDGSELRQSDIPNVDEIIGWR